MTIIQSDRRSFLKTTLTGITSALVLPPVWYIGNQKAKKNIKFRFAVASDGHYGQPETDSDGNFTTLIDHLNREKQTKGLDLAVFNGDLIHDQAALMPKVKTHFDRLQAPYYTVRGNHDMVTPDAWQQTWGYPLNHDVEMGKYAFIFADTSNEKGEYLCADMDWLDKRVQHYAGKQAVFVFMHITPNKWTKYGVECPDIMRNLENAPNVAAIFHGHDHDVDGVKRSGNKPYLFDGHFGGNWGVDYKGYRVVEIYKDDTMFTYQYNPVAKPFVNSTELAAK